MNTYKLSIDGYKTTFRFKSELGKWKTNCELAKFLKEDLSTYLEESKCPEGCDCVDFDGIVELLRMHGFCKNSKVDMPKLKSTYKVVVHKGTHKACYYFNSELELNTLTSVFKNVIKNTYYLLVKKLDSYLRCCEVRTLEDAITFAHNVKFYKTVTTEYDEVIQEEVKELCGKTFTLPSEIELHQDQSNNTFFLKGVIGAQTVKLDNVLLSATTGVCIRPTVLSYSYYAVGKYRIELLHEVCGSKYYDLYKIIQPAVRVKKTKEEKVEL